MRVWIENPYDNLPCEGYRPMRFLLMARAFAAAGHDVKLFTSDFSHANKAPRKFIAPIDEAFKIEFVHEPKYPKNVCIKRILAHRVYAKNWLKRAREFISDGHTPDLLIVSIPPLATVKSALKIKRECGCKLVFDIMDAWPETFERLLPSWARWFGKTLFLPMRRAANRAYREADLVTGVCDRYEKLVKTHGGKEYKRFYHGIETTNEIPVERNGKRIVYAGNLGRGYDLGTAIKAVKQMTDATLDIAGAGELSEKWRELAKGEKRIRFHGYLGSEDLKKLLASSSIGLIPLKDESFVGLPYKLGDYVRNGLKCVSSLGGECAEQLAKYSIGLQYRSGDVASLIEAIEKTDALRPNFADFLKNLDQLHIYHEYVLYIFSAHMSTKI